MSDFPDRPDSSSQRETPPIPAGGTVKTAVRAARKKELTLRLFACFLLAVERGETFEWRAFRDELESALWDEAMKLVGGNGREAAALVGMPYSTFMNRLRPSRPDESVPEPGLTTRT